MAQDASLPTTSDVVAVTGGHPGNPWREQRLLSLYQEEPPEEAQPVKKPGLEPLANAA